MGGRWTTFTLLLLPAVAIVLVACDAAHTTAPLPDSQTPSVTQVIPGDTATDGSSDPPADSTVVPGEPHDCQVDAEDDTAVDPGDGGPGDGSPEAPPCSDWVIQ